MTADVSFSFCRCVTLTGGPPWAQLCNPALSRMQAGACLGDDSRQGPPFRPKWLALSCGARRLGVVLWCLHPTLPASLIPPPGPGGSPHGEREREDGATETAVLCLFPALQRAAFNP